MAGQPSARLPARTRRRMRMSIVHPRQGRSMLLSIPDIEPPPEGRQMRDRVVPLKFADGSATAGVYARTVKRNQQVENSPETQKLQDFVMQAIMRSVEFERFAFPRNMKPIMFSRYE